MREFLQAMKTSKNDITAVSYCSELRSLPEALYCRRFGGTTDKLIALGGPGFKCSFCGKSNISHPMQKNPYMRWA